jgi:hypothetical protein
MDVIMLDAPWSPAERNEFHSGIFLLGKNFDSMHQLLRSRAVTPQPDNKIYK